MTIYNGYFLTSTVEYLSLCQKCKKVLDVDFHEPEMIKWPHITKTFRPTNEEDIDWRLHVAGTNVEATVVAFGYLTNDKGEVTAIAAKVPGLGNQHITLAVKNGGKAVDSNYITNWVEIDPITVKTKAGSYCADGTVIFN